MKYFPRLIADTLRTLRVAAQSSRAGAVRVNYRLGGRKRRPGCLVHTRPFAFTHTVKMAPSRKVLV
jgi:hypothetical protein